MFNKYINDKGYLVYVSSGISRGEVWMSVCVKKPGAGSHRIKHLPLRETKEEAQADLDAYAQKKGWRITW